MFSSVGGVHNSLGSKIAHGGLFLSLTALKKTIFTEDQLGYFQWH